MQLGGITGHKDFARDTGILLTPEECADAVIKGLEAESFLILPHPQVAQYMRNKAENYDRWLGGMVKLKRALEAGKA